MTTIFPFPNPPRHVAIIMDGNGRWARQRGFERLKGHYQGAEALKRASQACLDIGISYLTVYAFSTENWQRPEAEISGLMMLMNYHLQTGLESVQKHGIRLRFMGERDDLSSDLRRNMKHIELSTQENTKLTLTIAFNYGARAEIVRAGQRLAQQVQDGHLQPADITAERLTEQLFLPDLPDPDLLIRTSNEFRLSNYLLWQLAYTELVVLKTFWPDFTKDDLKDAILQYQRRSRRYGRVVDQVG